MSWAGTSMADGERSWNCGWHVGDRGSESSRDERENATHGGGRFDEAHCERHLRRRE